ncbi:MAG TPA: NAD-dependent epimerase/dehydratase family protein [Jiangellaceae bacterium]|nr:NAD-dependent epimerase/dehydratase family protein [Jiangellaceae bacterium]
MPQQVPHKVVVTGASGNVGTSVVEALGRSDEVSEIVGVARREPSWHPPKTTWVTADVARDDLTEVFTGADVVIHLAWFFQPTSEPMTTWNVNVRGSIRVFDAAVRSGVGALVVASSVGAYSPGPDDGHLVDESWPTDGWAPAAYTREKAYVERVLDTVEATHSQLRVVRMRPAFMFKRTSASSQRRIFMGPFLPRRLVQPGLVPVVPDLPGLRFQALHSDDAAEAYVAATVRPVHGAFNVGGDDVLDAEALRQILGARATVPVHPRLARTALGTLWRLRAVPAPPDLLDAFLHLPVMDDSRARRDLGWSPRYTAADTLREFLQGLYDGSGAATAPLEPDNA